MSDIHQEWKDLRAKNGEFLNHLDCAMAKLEKKQVELKRREPMQDLSDAGAFAMQFVALPPFNCCQDDSVGLAQANRIKTLEKELLALNAQLKADLSVKKDLDEKLDKAAADYKALWVENDRLKDQLTAQGKILANAQACNVELSNVNAALRQRNQDIQGTNAKLREMAQKCSAFAQQGMQSKIAKQAAEIKRLTEENEALKDGYSEQVKLVSELLSARAGLKHEIDALHGALDVAAKDTDENLERCNVLRKNNEDLKESLKIVAKDAEANFERGKIKGMEEIWAALQWVQDKIEGGFLLMPIYGYYSMADCVNNLTSTAFLRKTIEWQEKEARDIEIGDEVEVFDQFCPDDNPHSDIGIVVIIDSERHSYVVVGPNFEGCFDETDIQSGTVKKTGKHFDSIPLDYLA